MNLWEGLLQNKEAIQLVVSLIEQDMPPWDLDDHIGSVKITLANDNGKLQTKYSIPNFQDQPEVIQPNSKYPLFILKGDGSQYKVAFEVKQKK